jgi:hypothetical protein
MKQNALKLHLYIVEVHEYTYRVLMLRPSEGVRFSNNYYHDTWHLLAGIGGAEILAQLFWGMAFQRQPGTLLMLDAPHLTPTPFEAAAPLPVLIAQAGLARMDDDSLRALRRKLSQRKAPTATVKWKTFGFDDSEAFYRQLRPYYEQEEAHLWKRERMSLRGGMICYTAPPLVLRAQAHAVRRARDSFFFGSSYTYLAADDRWRRGTPEGEVQIFSDFDDRVGAARLARAQEAEASGTTPLDDRTHERIWKQTERFTKARKAARQHARQAKQRAEVAAL